MTQCAAPPAHTRRLLVQDGITAAQSLHLLRQALRLLVDSQRDFSDDALALLLKAIYGALDSIHVTTPGERGGGALCDAANGNERSDEDDDCEDIGIGSDPSAKVDHKGPQMAIQQMTTGN